MKIIENLIKNVTENTLMEFTNGNITNSIIIREIDKQLQQNWNISPNVLKHIQIAELQDELVKLGLEEQLNVIEWHNWESQKSKKYENIIQVYFYKKYVYLQGETFDYTSPTFQHDVLTKIKELVNEN